MPRRERRAQLLEAAQEVFVAQGYHAAAMDDIAERAGVSKPVLYQHFPASSTSTSRCSTHCDDDHRHCREAMASTPRQQDARRGDHGAYFDFVARESGAFRLVFESDLTNEPAVRERVDRVTSECAAMIADDPRRHRPARRGPSCWPSPWWEWPRSARGSGWPAAGDISKAEAAALRRARLARHRGYPTDRRALTTSNRNRKEDPWRSRSACSTPRASSCVETDADAEDVESRRPRRSAANGVLRLDRRQGPQGRRPGRQSPTSRSAGVDRRTVGFR